MNDFLNEITAQFEQAKGFENKYMLLLKLAKSGEFLENEQCIDENEVAGCEAKVWLTWTEKNGKVQFLANSDSRLIKAILWIIVNVYNHKNASQALDCVSILQDLGLGNVVSQSRQNGILKIQQKIEQIIQSQ